jgi:hypothetical protein
MFKTIMNAETANLLAKRMAPDLSCPSCKALGLRSDGLSKGRLRLICLGCRRSSYADSHPRVQAELKAMSENRSGSCSPVKHVAPSATSTPATSAQMLQVRKPSTSHSVDYIAPHVEKSTTSRHVDYMPHAHVNNISNSQYVEHFPTLRSSPKRQGSLHAPSFTSEHTYMESDLDEDQMIADHMGPDALRTLEFAEEMTSISCEIEDMKKNMDQNKHAINALANTSKQSANEIATMKKTLELILLRIEQLATHPMAAPQPVHRAMTYHVADSTTSYPPRPMSPTPLHPSQPITSSQKPTETWSEVTKRGAARQRPINTVSNRPMTEENRFKALATHIPAYAKHDNVASFEATRQPKIKKLSKEEMANIKHGRPARTSSPMIFLHFKGFRRNRISDVKSFLYSLDIPLYCIRNISFIGKSVMEITTFLDMKDMIVSRLHAEDVVYIPDFDPLDISNLKDEGKFGNLKDESAKSDASQKLYIRRLTLTLERLPKTARNTRLRNFYESIINNLNKQPSPNVADSTTLANVYVADTSTSDVDDIDNMSTTSNSDITISATPMDVEQSSTSEHVDKSITSETPPLKLKRNKRGTDTAHFPEDKFRKNFAQDPDALISDSSSNESE